MYRGAKTYLTGIMGIGMAFIVASCEPPRHSQAYECIQDGSIVDQTVMVASGEDVYFGSLENQSPQGCVRVWHYVSVGGGRQYQCRTEDGNWNLKRSKTTPENDPWSSGRCEDLGRPTTPTILSVSSSGLVEWTASLSNIVGHENDHPDGYFLVTSTMPISDEFFRDKLSRREYLLVSASSSTTESFRLSIGPGNYYLRIQAENANGAQVSGLSAEKPFSIESNGVSIYPNPIAKSGITRARLTLGSNYSGNFSDLTLRVAGTTVAVKQDIDKNNVFYFTPPVPTSNSAMSLHINSGATGNIDDPNAIGVKTDYAEQVNAILQGNIVDVEEAFSDVKGLGLVGVEAQARFIDEAYANAQPAVDILQNLWLEFGTRDNAQVGYTFTSHIKESQDLVEKLFKTFGPIVSSPVAKQAAGEPQWGRSGWFSDVKKLLDAGETYYFKRVGNAMYVAVKADAYNLQTFVNQTAGMTITEAVAANPNARLVFNGSVFRYMSRDKTYKEPLISAGIVINDGTVQPTSCAELTQSPLPGCEQLAKWRWWFGQLYNGTYQHGGRLKSGPDVLQTSGHPPLPHKPPLTTDLKSAIGGLYIYITDRTTLTSNPNPGRHIVTAIEDNDLGVFQSIKGVFGGWGGIAYDSDTKILTVFSKASGTYQNLSGDVQALFDMGADWCVGTDGGSSAALALQKPGVGQFEYLARSGRHDDSKRPVEDQTVTNYFVLVPK